MLRALQLAERAEGEGGSGRRGGLGHEQGWYDGSQESANGGPLLWVRFRHSLALSRVSTSGLAGDRGGSPLRARATSSAALV